MKKPETFHALRNYNFRLFWFGQLISLVGTWMQTVGQAWLVLELTHSPLALGTVAALQFLPISLFTLFAGVFVDRWPKRRILLVTQSASLIQALILAVLVHLGLVQVWHVYILATTLGLINSIDTPTRQSFIMEMVGREDLVNAIALNSSLVNTARVIGPAISGILIASIGMTPCFYINALSFVAVIIGLALMRDNLLHRRPERSQGTALHQMGEGLSYALHTPAIMVVVIVMGTMGTFAYNFNTTLPLVARTMLGLGADGFGSLFSAQGLGSLAAGLVVATRGRVSEKWLFLGAAGVAVFLLSISASSSYPCSLVIMFMLGICSIIFSTAANTQIQLTTPDVLRGRVMSLYTFLFLGTTPVGGLVTGWMAEHWGIARTLAVQGSMCVAGITAALVYRRGHKTQMN